MLDQPREPILYCLSELIQHQSSVILSGTGPRSGTSVFGLHRAFIAAGASCVALVIGIDTDTRGIPLLRTATNDASAVGRRLEEDHGDVVPLLTDAAATRICNRGLPVVAVAPARRNSLNVLNR